MRSVPDAACADANLRDCQNATEAELDFILKSTVTGKSNAEIVFVEVLTSADIPELTTATLAVSNGRIESIQGEGRKFTVAVRPVEDGLVALTIKAGALASASGAKNSKEATFKFEHDRTAPTAVLTTAVSESAFSSPISYALAFSEEVFGLTIDDLKVVNGTATHLAGSGIKYAFDVVPTAGGEVSVSLGAALVTDSATNGNVSTAVLKTTYLSARPGVVMSLSTAASSSQQTVRVTVTFSEPVLGFGNDDLILTNAVAGPVTRTWRAES